MTQREFVGKYGHLADSKAEFIRDFRSIYSEAPSRLVFLGIFIGGIVGFIIIGLIFKAINDGWV